LNKDRFNFTISILLVGPVLLGLHPVAVLAQEEQQWPKYENEDLGFAVLHPSDWAVEEVEEDLIQFRNSDGTLRVEISREVLTDPGVTLEQYSDMRIADLEENAEDFDEFQSTSATVGVGKYPSQKIVYKLTDSETGESNTVTRFWTIQDDVAYSIAYIGVEPRYFNSYSIALKIFDSFQIVAT
jgi:hypothetical protein